ncbi:MAG: hypothetical protein Q4B17_08735 [Lautropia sp.]|nr:hypothetical protein [Lautropia sp.]
MSNIFSRVGVRVEPGHDSHRVHEVEQGGQKAPVQQHEQGRER